MRKIVIAMLAAALGALTGCGAVLSRNPLFPENAKEVVFDPALLGKWQDLTDNDKTIYEVSRLDDSAYAVDYKENGESKFAKAQLLKVRGVSLLDVSYLERESQDSGLTWRYFTYHVFGKARIEPDAVHLTAMDKEWLEKRVLATRKLAHYSGAGELVLTAPSAELRKTLLPYLDHPEAFLPEAELRRVK
jgi:hypothetical protein